VLIRAEGRIFEFDEVVVTVPLGCLKRSTPSFIPSIPQDLRRAITTSSYSSLEKVYLAFPVAFWDSPISATSNPASVPSSPFPDSLSFVHFLHPSYVPEEQKFWTLELNSLSSSAYFGNHAQAVLLFHTYGPCANHLISLTKSFSPTSAEYFKAIDDFFRPYYSLLPNYFATSHNCIPSAVLATNWQSDDLAGNGSYINFQVTQDVENGDDVVQLDNNIRVMRTGMPDRGIWLAGEHTAPFVAVGTTTGAYWSGESVGKRVLEANGLL
jgi:hypothetical protein